MNRKTPLVLFLATFGLVLGSLASGVQAASQPNVLLVSCTAIFNPATGELPFPNNLLFAGSKDGTLNIPVANPDDLADPRVALNALDGFSTVAPLTASFEAYVQASSLKGGTTVRVFEVVLNNPFLDPTTQAPWAITAVRRELQPEIDYTLQINAQSYKNVLNILPLRPLSPKTGYLVVLSGPIQDVSRDGIADCPDGISPSPTYAIAKVTNPLVDSSGKSIIGSLSDAQAQALEPLRRLVNNQESAAASQGIARERILLSWTFMTQSIDDVFIALNQNRQPLGLALRPTGATTAAVPALNLPGFSDIYAGALTIPYYLDKTKPLTSAWQTAAAQPVTRYQPLPAMTAALKIPVLLTLPNAKSGQRQPADGWPVVIFQHGITQNRSNLLLLADALSFAGFAAVAIDMPLHGITDPANPFYLSGLERTFDLDLVNNTTSAPGADGVIDPSGSYFINLQSLLTSRDNTRQAAADLRQLSANLPTVDLNGDGRPDLDVRQIHFVGHSLGGIVGGAFLATDDTVRSATLAMAGGGIAKLLDGSVSFGPRIAAGLAAVGILRGTPEYNAFLVAAQTAVDSGDPINYGAAAARLHPIHLIEVVGGMGTPSDQVVPNAVENAPLAGTEALARVMGLQPASRSLVNEAGVRAIVRFNQGDHSSIINPTAAVGATAEMQGQMIRFLQTEGQELEILYHPVVQ